MAKRKDVKVIEQRSRAVIQTMIGRWLTAKRNAKVWEEKEASERRLLAAALSPELLNKGGRERFDVGTFEAVMVVPLNTSVDPALVSSTLARLPKTVAPRVLRYKPELNAKYFSGLEESVQRIIEDMLIRKPGSVQLTVTPKDV